MASDPSVNNDLGPIQAMPLLPRDPESVWVRSAALRDEIYATVDQTCQKVGVTALVNKSIDFV